MLDWENRKELISSYEKDLREASRKHRLIAKKNKLDKAPEEVKDQAMYAEIISSTNYALYWLKNGYERPYAANYQSSLPKHKREQLWGKIEAVECRGIKSRMQLAFEDRENAEEANWQKTEQLQQLKEILFVLSAREKELFMLKHTAVLTEEECAEKMGLALGTVKSMSQRIRDKINNYFEYGHQMDLLDMFD